MAGIELRRRSGRSFPVLPCARFSGWSRGPPADIPAGRGECRHFFTAAGGVKRGIPRAPGYIVTFPPRCTMWYQAGIPTVFDQEASMRAFTVITALLFALSTLPAAAQEGGRPTRRTDAQKKEDKEVDDAYRAATRGGPAQASKVDPWSKVRAPEPEKKPK